MLRTGLYTAADIQVIVLFLQRRIRYAIGMYYRFLNIGLILVRRFFWCLMPAVFVYCSAIEAWNSTRSPTFIL